MEINEIVRKNFISSLKRDLKSCLTMCTGFIPRSELNSIIGQYLSEIDLNADNLKLNTDE